MNVLLTHAKIVLFAKIKLMGTPANVLMDTMELTVNQVIISFFYIILLDIFLPTIDVMNLRVHIV